ncbi:HAD-IIIC family phosphatase [Sphingomonas sp. JC676]|uniref:HAD-IIIC family phosphatase n=1 Tax=Sphingomonas sp. JC676 TaxID=2768065 RepID=UPI0016583442|nr:HAD-IIIC family phosphatase [Sphingomonas sp. JC676]MBC9034790.1 HAD-IIIC family phosphatase [Sphingomonas sp. JC676]
MPSAAEPVKLIIWDLDDTLWRGTLADGDAVALHAHRAEMIRAFNARGVVSSICSKNDFETARAKLVLLDLWDEFVFPHIAFTPKPEAIRAIIEDMQLRPANVLFVDDNTVNLGEVRHCLPGIQTLDITDADADDHLAGLLALQSGRRNRIDDYRMLERKQRDRGAAALSNEDFLRSCEIRACAPFLMDNLDFAGRIAELINRSNQLNYTKSRVEQEALERDIMNVARLVSWSVFVWDRYGDYGLVGFVMIDLHERTLVHFTFSCRVMHMGLEEYALGKVLARWPDIDISPLEGRFSRTPPDWIEDCSFDDPAIRGRLLAEQVPVVAEPALRIMFGCQSGGIAHFSHFRPAIEFDNNPRMFELRMLDDASHLEQHFPPFLVYGATIDYLDMRWPGKWHLLDIGLYEKCVIRMCIFLLERGLRMLVVLPPEDAPDDKYRVVMNQTRARTQHFNALWRKAARENPEHVWILDVAHLVEGDEMADVTHYYAGLLQKIAGQIDCWVQDVALGGGAQAEAA